MKPSYLLDSTVLIDHLRGVGEATRWLGKLRQGEAVISVIARAEVLCGETEEEALAAYELCERFECPPLTKDAATTAAELRRNNGWKLPDAFQAAMAMQSGLKLVTRNTRDFNQKRHAFVLIPYRLG